MARRRSSPRSWRTPDDEFYDAKVKVLSEQIKHHVKEEEQRGGMFAQAKDDGDVDLVALGAASAHARKCWRPK